jgi:leucyl aminopeptidase
MKLSLAETAASTNPAPCLVIGVTESGPLHGAAAEIDKASNGAISKLLDSKDISTSVGETTVLHQVSGVTAERIMIVGFGKPEKLTAPVFDRACRKLGTALRDSAVTECYVYVHELEFGDVSFGWKLRQAALAIGRSNYRYTTTKQRKDLSNQPLKSATFQGGTENQAAIEQASGLTKGFLKARDLGDLPANICNPAYLAQEAKIIAQENDSVELEILNEAEMAELGMDALLGVSRGSANSAYFIILKHTGAKDDSQPVVLVGKGITFDSGGLSLKPPENMMQMKFDMCGAAGVLGAFVSCVSLQLPLNVICVVAAAENMPDADAYRPGDVLTSMSGKTIEVLNTDAEGRLALCDALTYSARFNPKAIIDVATLTGACVVALGHHASGLICNNDELAAELITAGDELVDRAWRLPLWDDYQSQLETPFADMKNVGGMPAGTITAGCFLSRFIEDLPWAHLDIAGSAWKWGEQEGATGRPVGLLTAYLMSVAGVDPV